MAWPKVVGLAAVVCLYAGLTKIATQDPEPHLPYIQNWFNWPNEAIDVWAYPPRLKVDRAYRRKYPERDFAFRFVTEEGFSLDTFAGTVTKDMGRLPDTTIALQLTKEEMKAIYDAVLASHFFELPEPHPPYDGDSLCHPEHPDYGHGTIEITVRSGGQYKTVTWDTRIKVGPGPIDSWKYLWRVAETMYGAALRRQEYKDLPKGKYRAYV